MRSALRQTSAVIGPRKGTDRHSRFVVRRWLCLARTRASKVDCPIVAGRWLETRSERATSVTGGDDAAAISGLSCDEVPPMFVHFRDPSY